MSTGDMEQITPAQFEVNNFLPNPPPIKYRCTKGHEWTEDSHWNQASNTVWFYDGTKTSPPFCTICILEFMKQHIGIVQEVVG